MVIMKYTQNRSYKLECLVDQHFNLVPGFKIEIKPINSRLEFYLIGNPGSLLSNNFRLIYSKPNSNPQIGKSPVKQIMIE